MPLPFDWLRAAGLSLPRMLAVFMFLPLFGKAALPGLLRVGLALVMCVPVIPLVQAHAPVGEFATLQVLLLIAKESLLGAVLGWMLSIPFWAAEAVGFLIDNQRGATISGTSDPVSGLESSPFSMLLGQAFVVLVIIYGGMPLMLDAIYDSYRLWPIFEALPALDSETVRIATGQINRLMRIALLVAAPVLITMALVEAALAVLSLFVPQVQVFFLAMSVKSAVALLVLAAYVVTFADLAGVTLNSTLEIAAHFLQAWR